ncbi:YjjG family noncanonical pyrimidine nucleotidase [Clostridium beijerinckii]|jgi:2-haloacid dehalogenase|uniref:YjjG family noncanonical pyrimidine nucleotidase n=2 Tax=Clostridium beijerinckii TaxID=1520 RepID=A0AB74VAX1_CLOBE|nr:YjjG family noncanonical pyrimidine nucleotidase [Clostridium beijerinckii]MBC2458987.1 noncanonical pyrimidine nucleotidase, YjjG family [Clostridium beijerinckii]MBC2476523.1 noncanonical pyrimidine nucleotidase, YjjG family [Clostridium beijerinckii]MCI1579220.1 YjjG family noncanonical pyrimidine nucleotidase [Clostridium beijerinckii]MCI1625269.1 YjjG family noncanonical pyrimidine nucleotidase [Clostridium beijerinckii]NOV60921.1 2-haloacid dehalogenase [Clostridium beijerinckii]
MKYNTLLFDVDNTLLDFDANEGESFKSLIRDKGEIYSEELYEVYKKINQGMWADIELGKIKVDEVLNTRFSKLMSEYGKSIDGGEWEKTYRLYLNQGVQLMPDAHEVLSKLHEKYTLYIVTNGIARTQYSRINGAGISQYFKDCFISEDIGANKPAIEFFNYVKDHVEGFNEAETLIIGDSITSDIKGGNLAGIDTCWFCKEGTVNESSISPNYEIHSLKELLQIL